MGVLTIMALSTYGGSAQKATRGTLFRLQFLRRPGKDFSSEVYERVKESVIRFVIKKGPKRS